MTIPALFAILQTRNGTTFIASRPVLVTKPKGDKPPEQVLMTLPTAFEAEHYSRGMPGARVVRYEAVKQRKEQNVKSKTRVGVLSKGRFVFLRINKGSIDTLIKFKPRRAMALGELIAQAGATAAIEALSLKTSSPSYIPAAELSKHGIKRKTKRSVTK